MSVKKILASAAILSAALSITTPAQAGVDPFIGEIMVTGYNFCPRGYANTDGQLLPINSHQALFSLLGTTYGGDGRTSFGLPDLRGRVPIHLGNGPGLTNRTLGSRSGSETNTQTVAQMPSHTHQGGIRTTGTPADNASPQGNSFGITPGNTYVDNSIPTGRFMHASTVVVQNTGGGQAQNNMQPFLTMRYCIALVGTFPSRN